MKTLPKEFGDLSQLTHLSLDGNQLEFLPDEFCRLSLLSKLDLGYNKLNALPAEFGKLTQLKEVNVNNNNLQSLPASIGDLNHIVELDAISNPLTSLPPEIMKLPQVASLNIERGGLVGIPDSVWRFINHNGCYISKVPATIAGKKLSYYLQQASIDPTAKLFVSGKLSLMYDMMSYNFYQSLDTIPDANKSFYVFVINAMLESTVIDRDGYTYYPQSEMQTICASLLVQRPCTFFKDIRHGAYQSSFQKWMETIGSLYDVYNYTVTMTDINTKLKVCGNAYLKEAQELIEPLFYSEK
ncbi:MAG: leucine-rich repeat domain-containing protein [Flavobacteriia bacterium]|nr:leucine-rich repeat domain-containing protein [Flavobacteriia bacterium]